MHSEDPQKDGAAFQAEFENILRRAGDGEADFSAFVFPTANSGEAGVPRTFAAKCNFYEAKFLGSAMFDHVHFMRGANFTTATFMQSVWFFDCVFPEEAPAEFEAVEFKDFVNFIGTEFGQGANFSSATFKDHAAFNNAIFRRDSDFRWVSFEETVDFGNTQFHEQVDFTNASFLKRVQFQQTAFRGDPRLKQSDSLLPGAVFSGAFFANPELVQFSGCYLGNALFHNCDVTTFWFSNVTWRERRRSRKRIVFDEVAALEQSYVTEGFEFVEDVPATQMLKIGGFVPSRLKRKNTPAARNYPLVAEVYHQLKTNFDNRNDFWTAGDFHYGEMEMKRLADPGPILFLHRVKSKKVRAPIHRFRLRWHQTMGLAAWYKRASEYGESYLRPLSWLATTLLAFTILYGLVGLEYDVAPVDTSPAPAQARRAAPIIVSYSRPCSSMTGRTGSECHSRLGLTGNSFMTALYVGALQKDLRYTPDYPWGRLLAILQLLLTGTLVALFLLAIRRQFRR
jgi:uncharacterized protein YjbI with pentapeptide repeats